MVLAISIDSDKRIRREDREGIEEESKYDDSKGKHVLCG